jgi:hypothetical protein
MEKANTVDAMLIMFLSDGKIKDSELLALPTTREELSSYIGQATCSQISHIRSEWAESLAWNMKRLTFGVADDR